MSSTYSPQDINMIPVKSLNSRYQFISSLGSGSFGTVSLYKIKDGALASLVDEMENLKYTLLYPLSIQYKYLNNLVAIKTMNKRLKRISDYSKVKEVKFIFSVESHFNLVQIIDVFIDKTYLKLNIVMENMDHNLYQLMKIRKGVVFSPKTLKSILSQVLSAILHIHKHMFFHRDVKPENILVMQNLNFFGSKQNIPLNQYNNSYIIKLADYGLARHSKNNKPFTAYVSTRWYRSPEILLRQGFYSFPIDIWAFGCVAVECATFCPLFPGANELDQCCKIMDFLGNPDKSYQILTLENCSYNFNYNFNIDHFEPFGGFWEDAKNLALKLGLKFPNSFGFVLDDFINRQDFEPYEKNNFFHMIKSCLTWDPNKRATALDLFHCPYFQNSVVSIKNDKENNSITNINKNNLYSNIQNINKNNLYSNIQNIKQSMFFAGINNKKEDTLNKDLDFNNHKFLKQENLNELNNFTQSFIDKSHQAQISQPGLGIRNKFNFVNGSKLINCLNNYPFDRDIDYNENTNHPQKFYMKSTVPNKSLMCLKTDSIDDYIGIYPNDIYVDEFNNNTHGLNYSYKSMQNNINLRSSDKLVYETTSYVSKNENSRLYFDSTPTDELLANDIYKINEIDGRDENSSLSDNVQKRDEILEIINNENDDENKNNDGEENEDYDKQKNKEVDEVDDDDDVDDEFIALELGKITHYLQNPQTNLHVEASDLSIKHDNNRNSDLIDAINYALDGNYNVKNAELYSWDEQD